MSDNSATPRSICRLSDANARRPGSFPDLQSTLFNPQCRVCQVLEVLPQIDPKRLRKIARPPAQLRLVKRCCGAPRTARAAAPHQAHALDWMQRADQDGRRPSVRFGDRIDEIVNAVLATDGTH